MLDKDKFELNVDVKEPKVLIIDSNSTKQEIINALKAGIPIVANGGHMGLGLIDMNNMKDDSVMELRNLHARDCLGDIEKMYATQVDILKERPEQVYGHYRAFEYSKRNRRSNGRLS